ncbi:MAG TPA: hypothetical protein VGS10_03500 [Terracidiphilus sp.]|nr:hypothetical protein [Terracidiphilus sp.]
MWTLEPGEIQYFRGLPETGMGFQFVETLGLNKMAVLVFNCERAVDLSQVDLKPGVDPEIVLRNGVRVIEAILGDETEFRRPLSQVRLLNSPRGTRRAFAAPAIGIGPHIALPSSLVKQEKLMKNRPFHRFSAFNPDWRVDRTTGSFIAGTYAAPESEVPFVPTGFVAVGRFALPNKWPASYLYEIEAPVGTIADFGTVAPAFGQAGGGVEAYFPHEVKNAAGTAVVKKIPED